MASFRTTAALAILCAVLVSCSPPTPANAVTTMNPAGIAGVYRGPNLTLEIRPDSSAAFSQGSTVTEGRWSSLPPQLRFDFSPGNSPRPDSITWTIQGADLVPLIWDKSVYGQSGPVLHRAK